MEKREFKMQISIPYGGFEQPVEEFTRILKMITVEEITEAYVRAISSPEHKVEDWGLHLYTKDTRISFQDAVAGYYGDSPRLKTFKILQMAGFDVDVETICNCKEDFYLQKENQIENTKKQSHFQGEEKFRKERGKQIEFMNRI